MVVVLLRDDRWTQCDLNEALLAAVVIKRTDLAELLLEKGAQAEVLDFEEICETVDPEFMEKMLRGGADPMKENGFARGLDYLSARPLLRFYRSLREEFPSLHLQASLALAEAASKKRVRWTALLAWAGADPHLKVPDDLSVDWDFSEEDSFRTAARDACWSGKAEVVKVLQLKKDPDRLRELLEWAAVNPSVGVFKELLSKLGGEDLNTGTPASCRALEKLVECGPFGYECVAEDEGKIGCMRWLIESGARWSPEWERIGDIRRYLLRHSYSSVGATIRVLYENPNALDRGVLVELCRTPAIRRAIEASDPRLLRRISSL